MDDLFEDKDRVVVLIDGANFYSTARALGLDIDYKALLAWLKREAHILRVIYYTTILERDEYAAVRPLIDFLDYNGYSVVTKPAREFTDAEGRRRIKGSMEVELAVDAMELAPHADHFVLATGDGNYKPLAAALQRQGKRVTVMSTTTTQPPMVADDLRRQADQFLDLKSLAEVIGREPREPREGRPRRHSADETVD